MQKLILTLTFVCHILACLWFAPKASLCGNEGQTASFFIMSTVEEIIHAQPTLNNDLLLTIHN